MTLLALPSNQMRRIYLRKNLADMLEHTRAHSKKLATVPLTSPEPYRIGNYFCILLLSFLYSAQWATTSADHRALTLSYWQVWWARLYCTLVLPPNFNVPQQHPLFPALRLFNETCYLVLGHECKTSMVSHPIERKTERDRTSLVSICPVRNVFAQEIHGNA